MKTEIHPEYVESHVRCTCGNEFTTRSTKPQINVEICSNCHPFYTGKQKLMDTGGRVEIAVETHEIDPWLKRHRAYRLPIVRGVVALAESLSIGFKALNISANAQLPDDEEPISGGMWAGTVVVALLFAIGLFFVIP